MNRFMPGNRDRAAAQRRASTFPALIARDRRAPSAKSGSRPTSSPTTTPGRASPTRWSARRSAASTVRVLVDGWGARALPDAARSSSVLRRRRRRAAEVPAGGRAVAVPLASAAPAASQAVPRRRPRRVRRRHQRHRRHEHAGAQAAARRLRGARARGRCSRRSCRRCSACGRSSSSCSSSAATCRCFPSRGSRAARGHADREVRHPRQPAPPPRHRARLPRGDPHRASSEILIANCVFLSRRPLPPRADRRGASAACA